MLAGHCTVGDYVIMGGGAAVHQFVRIGDHAFIGAMSGVGNDVIPYGMAINQQREAHLSGLNIIGLKRRGFSREDIHELRRAYRLLFANEGTLKERVEDVASEFESHPLIHEILDFIREGGERAICPLVIGLVAGESSGDQLGARLMEGLLQISGSPIRFVGVGGPLMEGQGLKSLFPMRDIAVNGVLPVVARLPLLLRRIRETANFLAQSEADIVVHIDAQDFNQRVARRLKRLAPQTPLIGYVSPTVWAWRPGRAKKIRPLFKRLLAVLPFEPETHRRLGGPETLYVGHPLMERQQNR
eukprot:gene47716-63993_t